MKVILFLADGFEEIEALATVDILRRAEIAVETVSISATRTVTGAHNVPVTADTVFNDADFTDVQMVILPGGMPGAQHLNEHDGVRKVVTESLAKGKRIAAICAAPMVFGEMNLLNGKRATCYPGIEPRLIGAQVTGEKVTVDGLITTGKGPGLAFDFALQLVEQIAGKEKRREVEAGLLL